MYLNETELKATYFPAATNMQAADVSRYLRQANSYVKGQVGGELPKEYIDEDLKAAVGLAFEIMAKETTDEVDPETGNITKAATAGAFARNGRQYDPFETVNRMCVPYALKYAELNAKYASRGAVFL